MQVLIKLPFSLSACSGLRYNRRSFPCWNIKWIQHRISTVIDRRLKLPCGALRVPQRNANA